MKNLISLRLQVWSLWTLKVESESQSSKESGLNSILQNLEIFAEKISLPTFSLGQEVSSQHFSCRSPLLLPSFHFVYEWSKKNCSLKSFLLSWMCRFTIIIYLRNVQKWEDQPGWSSPQAQRTISTFCLHEKQKCFLCCLGSGCLRRFQVG